MCEKNENTTKMNKTNFYYQQLDIYVSIISLLRQG